MIHFDKKQRVYLSENEMLALDGKCSSGLQKLVDDWKQINDLTRVVSSSFVAAVLQHSIKYNTFDFHMDQFSECNVCGTQRDYQRWSRNSRYHKKGDIKRDKPVNISSVTFYILDECKSYSNNKDNTELSTITKTMCVACARPIIQEIETYILQNLLEVELKKNQQETIFKIISYYKCKECQCETGNSHRTYKCSFCKVEQDTIVEHRRLINVAVRDVAHRLLHNA